MGPKINAPTMLSIIGIIQPASVENVQKYLQLLFPDLGSILDHQQIHKFCMNQANDGWLLRVARDPDLFSLTELGNSYLPRPLRLIRDKSRIYLLKFSRRARVKPSREGYASELGGVAPPVDASLILEGPEANKIDLVVPRGQSYWPRYSKQFVEDTGPLRSSRDDNFQFLSFASLEQLALGCRKEKKDLKLNFDTLGAMLGISPRLIVQIANRPNRHYRQFQIPKKNGGYRDIESPRVFLKTIQQFLLDYYLEALPVSDSVFSYRFGRSIVDNAVLHVGKKFVAGLDIEDFFGSITRDGVNSLLRSAGYEREEAELLSGLCCKDNALPQGAPTSPVLSNAYLLSFDLELKKQCDARGLVYTRYADDITISGEDIDAMREVMTIARLYLKQRFNLIINEKKTRIATCHSQQRVTGVVVNEFALPSRKFRRQIRAAFHNAKKNGPELSPKTIANLRGYCSYLSVFERLRSSSEVGKYRDALKSFGYNRSG